MLSEYFNVLFFLLGDRYCFDTRLEGSGWVLGLRLF